MHCQYTYYRLALTLWPWVSVVATMAFPVTPRIISRFLFSAFLPYFLVTLGVLGCTLSMIFFVQLLQWAAEKGIALIWTVSSFGNLLPYLLSLALPIAFLVGMLLTLGQLAESGEIIALRASGFSFREILRPFFAVAAALSVALLLLNHSLSPAGLHVFRDSFREGLRQITRLDIEGRSLLDLGPFKFFAETADRKNRTLTRVLLYRPGAAEGQIRVQAARGSWQLLAGRGVELVLQDGELQLPSATDPSRLTLGHFDRYTVFVPFMTKSRVREPSTREQTTPALRLKLGDPKLEERRRAEARTEIAARSAIALSPLIFFCMAAPLGLRIDKRSRSMALVLSLAVLFGFYALLSFGIILGNRSNAAAPFAPWMADLAGLAAGWLLMRSCPG